MWDILAQSMAILDITHISYLASIREKTQVSRWEISQCLPLLCMKPCLLTLRISLILLQQIIGRTSLTFLRDGRPGIRWVHEGGIGDLIRYVFILIERESPTQTDIYNHSNRPQVKRAIVAFVLQNLRSQSVCVCVCVLQRTSTTR